MSIMMPDNKHGKLVEDILKFIVEKSRRHPLCEWQQLLGYCNWALNAYPLLQPALQSSYKKIRGKTMGFAGVRLNKQVIQDLTWFANRIQQNPGVHFLESQSWGEGDAELTLLMDASQTGLAFWTLDF